MLIFHKGHTDTIQVYSVTVMTHVKALQDGHSSQGTSEPITPVRHAQAQVCYRQFNIYPAKITSNGEILYLNCPKMDVLM